jgi:hypothetical protein
MYQEGAGEGKSEDQESKKPPDINEIGISPLFQPGENLVR